MAIFNLAIGLITFIVFFSVFFAICAGLVGASFLMVRAVFRLIHPTKNQ